MYETSLNCNWADTNNCISFIPMIVSAPAPAVYSALLLCCADLGAPLNTRNQKEFKLFFNIYKSKFP